MKDKGIMRVYYCWACGKVSGRKVTFNGVGQVWCEDEECANAKYALIRDKQIAALRSYVDQANVDAKFERTRKDMQEEHVLFRAQMDTIVKKYENEWSSEYTGQVVARSLEGILRKEDECRCSSAYIVRVVTGSLESIS